MPELSFEFCRGGASRCERVAIEQVVIAGWTGRDPAAIRHHIDELAAIGIEPPSTVPLYYRVAASLLTQASTIQVLGGGSSGEIEPVLFGADGRLWLTLGSDHTDREAEKAGVALSKQLCPKPLARTAWSWDEIHQGDDARPDGLQISSSIIEDGLHVAYQRGSLAQIRPLTALIAGLEAATGLVMADGVLMFCGTLPAVGGVRPAGRFLGQLEDPAAARTLSLDYTIEALPVVR